MYEALQDVFFTEDNVYCNDCKQEHVIVAAYNHFIPDPPILKLESEQRRKDTLLFGLEFEYEMDWSKYQRNMWTEDIIGKMLKDGTPKDVEWGYVKHDGSMRYGVEFTTHPMTVGFYLKNRETMNEMLASWKRKGFRSDQWDNEKERYNCSLHVHMSKAAFTKFHIYKFVRFFYKIHMRKLIEKIAQRDENEFARFKRDDLLNTVALAKDKANVSGHRYSVINLIGGHWHEDFGRVSQTVEFRLFQASLKPKTVHKNIEFLLSVYRFTRDTSVTHITEKNYIKYLQNNRNRYRFLINFLNNELNKEV
jgi:hypothetical protein